MTGFPAGAAFLAAVATASPASAYDGNFLLELCGQDDIQLQNGCTGFAAGLYAALAWMNATPTEQGGLPQKFCPPPNVDMAQAADVIISYARQKPKFRHYPAAVIALMSMWDAFPCQ